MHFRIVIYRWWDLNCAGPKRLNKSRHARKNGATMENEILVRYREEEGQFVSFVRNMTDQKNVAKRLREYQNDI